MNKKAIIFGATGGIGSATKSMLENNHYEVFSLDRRTIDFTDHISLRLVDYYLRTQNPIVVVNCVGYFGSNNETHHKIMDINVGSNWSIIQHYLNNPPPQSTKIIMVGSSAYKSGRKDYILYAASKAALYNMWQGACENFIGTNVSLGLINPVKTRTSMANIGPNVNCLEPIDVANAIFDMTLTFENRCIDMNYPEKLNV